ncbi:5047_t:CDS:2 [Paraglomus occultum]|uniref:Guanine deaminase n=1 Tax=Paraglomus occultum TaxID=144539 RepID=A0A9N8ZPN9_9GLOM|nr:5047_t:CDS:2 [Paraglomus occultum]
MTAKLFIGTVVNPLALGEIQILENVAVAINKSGNITSITAPNSPDYERTVTCESIVRLPKHAFIIPGFIDCHIHSPQYKYAGTGTDVPLMNWLNKYAFPTERRFLDDADFATKTYSRLIKRCLSNGTTTACFFATIHLFPTLNFVSLIREAGMRAFVGKVSMDQNSPEYYIEDTNKAISAADEFVKAVLETSSDASTSLVTPVITPRFLPTCSPQLLKGLAAIAKKYDVPIQSHMSEALDEIEYVHQLYGKPDPEIFAENGLLTRKTIMAHSIHLSDDDIKNLRDHGTGIAHCPLSNYFFADGILRTRHLLRSGIKIGLGSDIAGGYSVSILENMRHAVISSKILASQRKRTIGTANKESDETDEISYKDAFYLATVGGAQVLNIDHVVGTIEVGKAFDAIIVHCADDNGNGIGGMEIWSDDTVESLFEKFINLGGVENIKSVYVAGNKVV